MEALNRQFSNANSQQIHKQFSTSVINQQGNRKRTQEVNLYLLEWQECVKRGTSVHLVGMYISKTTIENSMEFPLKTKYRTIIIIQQTHFRIFFRKKKKTLIRKDMCTLVFPAALFTIAKIQIQPKCPSTDDRIEKM